MFAPWIGTFASLAASIAQDRDTRLRAIGIRVAKGPVFAEGQIASLTVYPDCESESCPHHTLHVGIVRAGLEVIHFRHFAFDLHLQVATDQGEVLTGSGLGFFL